MVRGKESESQAIRFCRTSARSDNSRRDNGTECSGDTFHCPHCSPVHVKSREPYAKEDKVGGAGLGNSGGGRRPRVLKTDERAGVERRAVSENGR